MLNKNERFPHQQINLNDKEKALSVYGKEKFAPWEAKQHVEWIINNFKNHFSSLNYKEEPSVLISSGVDQSVRFIGSPISVLKPYLIKREIPVPGVFIHQDCIRTRNLDKLLDDDFEPMWGSYFPDLEAITPPERIDAGCNEAFDFFEKKLGITRDNILIRINSADKELLEICQKRFSKNNLEVDGRKTEYYRHKLGIKGYIGKNCNIALRNSDGNGFSDVANLIIIENSDSKICLEISIGTTTILKELYGLDHVQDGTPVEGLKSVDKKFRRKFEDAIITSAVLFREGLRPFGQHNRNRILKKYVQAISYFRAKCKVEIDDLKKIIAQFEEREFSGSDDEVTMLLVDFITAFEKELKFKKNLSQNQQKIKQALFL
ncbi:MAG: hypothetical protein NTX00_05605 [Candidatus Parcubacteria bacterium]|nr:hypothetical protein [Candidatus Parcubacteria bacterium]